MVFVVGMDYVRLEGEVAGLVMRSFMNYFEDYCGYLSTSADIVYSEHGNVYWLMTNAVSSEYAVAVANLVRNITEVIKYYNEWMYLENTYDPLYGAGTSFQWWGKEYLGFYIAASRDTYTDWERYRHNQSRMPFLLLLVPTSLLL